MRPLTHATLSLVAAACFAGRVPAQPAPDSDSSPSPATAPASAPATATSSPRPMTQATAALLAERMPKFTPTAVTSATPVSPLLTITKTPELPDLREVDRPRNTILRLQQYVVQEEKPLTSPLKERELLTPSGRLQLGLKRYPGLRFGSLPFLSNDGWALAMLEEDFRLERKAEMEQLTTVLTSPTDHAKAKDEVQKAFMRGEW